MDQSGAIYPDQANRLPKTVLLGDNDQGIRDLVAEVLHAEGYEVIQAENRKRAVEIFRQRQAEIGLIVLDMSNAPPSAQEALSTLRSMNASAKVLLLTGNSKQQAVKETMDKGFNAYVPKPFTVAELIEPLRRLSKPTDGVALVV